MNTSGEFLDPKGALMNSKSFSRVMVIGEMFSNISRQFYF